jgi:nucleoside-diphosphate-sugar epimerase
MPDERLSGQAFNFSLERPVSALEMVQEILALMGNEALQPQVLNEASHEIYNYYLDCSKAKAMLGWHAKYTLGDGLRETIAWYRTHFRDGES